MLGKAGLTCLKNFKWGFGVGKGSGLGCGCKSIKSCKNQTVLDNLSNPSRNMNTKSRQTVEQTNLQRNTQNQSITVEPFYS